MIPIILISRQEEKTKDFLDKFIKENSFSSSFIYTIKPPKAELVIDQIRQLKKELKIIFPKKRLFIIEALDISGTEVQNALLKTLEEMQENNQFIFPIKNIEKILPTIRSRAKTLNLNDFFKYKISSSTKALLEAVENKEQLDFLGSPNIQGISREELMTLLEEMIFFYKERLGDNGIKESNVIKKIMHSKDLLQNNNLNPQLTIDNILLFIHKVYTYNKAMK